DFEPRVAVFSGERGLDVIGPLVEQAHEALKPSGWLVMEIGFSMRDAVVNLLSSTSWAEVRVVPDLQGIPRVVAASKRSNSLRKMTSIPSSAKINLGLKTGPARPDGFHELRTVYQTLAMHDMVSVDVQSGSGIVIRCDDPRVPADGTNT